MCLSVSHQCVRVAFPRTRLHLLMFLAVSIAQLTQLAVSMRTEAETAEVPSVGLIDEPIS